MSEAQGIDENTNETLNVGGEADHVLQANALAWAALEKKLDRDPISAWSLVRMAHAIVDGQLTWSAEFRRNPHAEVPPLSDAEVAKRRAEAEERFNTNDKEAQHERSPRVPRKGHGDGARGHDVG